MKKIAIVGNIASGKSEIEKILVAAGYKTLCADKVSHKIFDFDKNIRQKIYAFFKTNDRDEIAKIIFSNTAKRKALEEIMHPEIKKEISAFLKKNKDEEFVFTVVPLLFEAKMQDMFDYIIFVCANENVRLERIIKRNGFNKEQALLRIKSQMSQEEKVSQVDFIVDNNGSIEDLRPQIENILKKLKQH